MKRYKCTWKREQTVSRLCKLSIGHKRATVQWCNKHLSSLLLFVSFFSFLSFILLYFSVCHWYICAFSCFLSARMVVSSMRFFHLFAFFWTCAKPNANRISVYVCLLVKCVCVWKHGDTSNLSSSLRDFPIKHPFAFSILNGCFLRMWNSYNERNKFS